MGTFEWLAIAAGTLFVLFIAVLILKIKLSKKEINNKAQQQEKNLVETKNMRYTAEQNTVNADGEINITLSKDDILLPVNITKIVGKDIKPGKYVMLSSSETAPTFNVRVGNYTQEYKHNQTIVLTEGEKICPVSLAIILR